MIKASGRTGDGRPLMVIGLSGENVTRLAAAEPILFDAAEVGLPPLAVVILYGRTEQDIADEIQAHGVRLNLLPEVPGDRADQ